MASSKAAICELTAGWEMPSLDAARVKFLSFST